MADFDLAALLCSRLSHDLTGPVGGIANGVELLTEDDDPDMQAQSLELLAFSAAVVSKRLQFYRLAFGAVGGLEATTAIGEGQQTAANFFADRRQNLLWRAGDGEQSRDFTFVTDVVDAIVTAAASDVSGEVFNVGSGAAVSVNRLVELLGARQTVHIPKRPGEPDITLADMTRIRDRLGWTPSVPIEEGVQVMLDNIDYWRDAPVWTPAEIDGATADLFKYLGDDEG